MIETASILLLLYRPLAARSLLPAGDVFVLALVLMFMLMLVQRSITMHDPSST